MARRNLDSSPRLLALVAARNEEEGVGSTLEELNKFLPELSFLLVDGHSTDRTVQIAKNFGAEILVQHGSGKGDAVADGISQLKGNEDYVIMTDADFTYPAGSIPEMIEILEKNPNVGMVCGNRFNGHFNLGKMHNILYFGNRLLAFVHNMLNGVELRDPLTGLRVIRADVLKGWRPRSKGFDIEVEMNHLVERKGYGIKEVCIDYRPRLGEKKLRITNSFEILKRMLLESTY